MKKYTPCSGNKFLFDNLGGRLFEVGDYSRGATIRGNTVLYCNYYNIKDYTNTGDTVYNAWKLKIVLFNLKWEANSLELQYEQG